MQRQIGRKHLENPFVPIARRWRAILIAYLLIYLVGTPVLREILYSSAAPLSGARVALNATYDLLLFLPILFYRRKYGWLHPLIFPTLFVTAKGFVKHPERFLKPLTVFDGPKVETLNNPMLMGFSETEMGWGIVEYQLLTILALLCYYAGFFFEERLRTLSARLQKINFGKPRHVTLVALGVTLCSAAVAAWYIAQHGGLNAYLLEQWGTSRSRSRGELGGTFYFVTRIGSIACLVWYALDEKAKYKPLFWGAFIFAVPINFFIRGSRSSVFSILAFFVVVWMFRHRKIPKMRLVGMGFLVIVMVGVMGDFRRSAWRGDMQWEIFTEATVEGAIERTEEEIQKRSNIQGGVPIMMRVPEEVGFLWGKSYAGAMLFFVPKFIWESKPRGGGGLNGEIILGRGEGGGGSPIGPEAEAYWNFHVPGMVVIFFLFGMFHQWIARVMRRHPVPALWAVYALVMYWIHPGGMRLTKGIRLIVVAIGILWLMRAVRIRWRQ